MLLSLLSFSSFPRERKKSTSNESGKNKVMSAGKGLRKQDDSHSASEAYQLEHE